MPEAVATDPTDETPEVPETPAASQSDEEVATLKKRIQGQTGAYNKLKADFDAARAEAESLSKWKAERERADMSEVERLKADRDEALRRATEAEARAARTELARQYPLAAAAFGDDPLPSEETLKALDERLAKVNETAESEPEPSIDPNSPRRPSRTPVVETAEDLERKLASFGNPFRDI